MPRTALVLSAGGSRGAFQFGALDACRRAGITFDVVAGVSVGALNGVLTACEEHERLGSIWEAVREEDVYGRGGIGRILIRLALWKIGLTHAPMGYRSSDPLRALLDETLEDVTLKMPFYAGRISLKTGAYVDEVSRERLVEQVLASASIPVYVPPVDIEGEPWVDGGVRTQSPLGRVLTHAPDRVVIINTQPLGEPPLAPTPSDILGVAERAVGIASNEIFNEDVRRYLEINRLVRQAEVQGATLQKNGRPLKYFRTLHIAPHEPIGPGTDFSRVKEWRTYGGYRARSVLQANPDFVADDPSGHAPS